MSIYRFLIVCGLVVSCVLMCWVQGLMQGHHIKSKLDYGPNSWVEGSQRSLFKSEYFDVGVNLDDLGAVTRSLLQVEVAGHKVKADTLTLKEFESWGLPATHKESPEHLGVVYKRVTGSNGSLLLRFGHDGRLAYLSLMLYPTSEADINTTVSLSNGQVAFDKRSSPQVIKALFGKPKDKELSLRIP